MAGQATVTIRDKQWNVSVAAAFWELAQGLGGLASMPPETGMLFDLGFPQTIQVTTVPMLFPLDIAFLADSLVITEVYRDIEPGYLVTSILPARYFLEVNAGELEGIDAGDEAEVEIQSPQEIAGIPDWTGAVISLMGFLVMGVFMVGLVQTLVKGLFVEPPRQPKLLPMVTPPGQKAIPLSPAARILEKWRTAKVRNSALALRDLETLGPDYDTADCRQALADYQGIERADYSDREEYQEAREEAWEESLECLESLAGEEEEMMKIGSQPRVVPAKGTHPKETGLNYLVDSPEYLTQTIEDIGYRQKIDNAFLEAIARARRKE